MDGNLAHDALCRVNARHGSDTSMLVRSLDFIELVVLDVNKLLTAPFSRRGSSSTSDLRLTIFDFAVGDFLWFGFNSVRLVVHWLNVSLLWWITMHILIRITFGSCSSDYGMEFLVKATALPGSNIMYARFIS